MSSENKKYSIEVTEKQLQVIKDACELYCRIQLGQFELAANAIVGSGLSDGDIAARKCITGALRGIWQEYRYGFQERRNEEMVAGDIWAVLDGRRGNSDFCLGSEPQITVKRINKG